MHPIALPGLSIPKLGLGTFRLTGADCTEAVLGALARGYRHIDTAKMYGNEDAVGAALAQTDVPRSAIHVTTKIWPDSYAPEAMRRSAETSLKASEESANDRYSPPEVARAQAALANNPLL